MAVVVVAVVVVAEVDVDVVTEVVVTVVAVLVVDVALVDVVAVRGQTKGQRPIQTDTRENLLVVWLVVVVVAERVRQWSMTFLLREPYWSQSLSCLWLLWNSKQNIYLDENDENRTCHGSCARRYSWCRRFVQQQSDEQSSNTNKKQQGSKNQSYATACRTAKASFATATKKCLSVFFSFVIRQIRRFSFPSR